VITDGATPVRTVMAAGIAMRFQYRYTIER
jgi:hypothetical protein